MLALAGCSSSSESVPTETGSTTAASTGASAPAETIAVEELVASGTCKDVDGSGSFQELVCQWLADADSAVCDRMTQQLLDELFTGSVESCRLAIDSLTAADDRSAVSFDAATVDGDSASLEVDDGARQARYAVTFVRQDGSWLLDTIRSTGRSGGGSQAAPARERDPAAERAIRELALRWYQDVDPAVCDSMTDAMLEFGWEKKGDAGRRSCRENIAAADPLVDVKVRRPLVNGDKARVTVVYTLDGDRLLDRLRLVRVDGRWLVDRVALVGFVP